MKLVGAGLGYSVNCRRGVLPVLSLQRAGLHFEFLERIREGQRQIEVVVWIVMCSSIQYVDQAVVQSAPACNGVGRRIPPGPARGSSFGSFPGRTAGRRRRTVDC